MSNPFDALMPKQKTVKIDGLDGDITIRELTLGEATSVNEKDSGDMMYEYVSMALVTPKMTVKQLKGLSLQGTQVLSDILKEVMPSKLGN